MTATQWTDIDTTRALKFWDEYQRANDVTDRKGQAVGIDPVSGRVWFGESIVEIGHQLDAEGITQPLYCTRVGSAYYQRKGGHR